LELSSVLEFPMVNGGWASFSDLIRTITVAVQTVFEQIIVCPSKIFF
jgi:hypothetical protein